MKNAKLGVHSLVFTDDWSEAKARAACSSAARIGYDIIEVLIFDPDTLDIPMTTQVVKESGLELRLGMALVPESDISSSNPETAANGEATIERCLQIASDMGAPAVSGITYAAFNNYDAPQTKTQRDQVLEAYRRLDIRAGELGVRLGIEPVNRYESYMVNTLDQAGDIIRETSAKNLFVHMDTFHMNIEEADISGAISRNADFLGYVHLADNHRGRLGAGTYDFKSFFRALANVGYAGDFTVESFSQASLGPDLVGALGLWRNPWSDADAAAAEALKFMQANVRAASGAEAAR